MTVGEMKHWLVKAGVSDDALLVVEASDHHYREVRLVVREAQRHPTGEIAEYYGPEYIVEGTDPEIIPVIACV